MESINPQITALFNAYINVKGLTGLLMNQHYEHIIFEAVQMGLTPEDLMLGIRGRQKGVRDGSRRDSCLLMRNIFGAEATPDFLDEVAAIKARARVRVVDPNRASALKATGRPEFYTKREDAQAPEETAPAKQVGEVKLIQDLRKAAQ